MRSLMCTLIAVLATSSPSFAQDPAEKIAHRDDPLTTAGPAGNSLEFPARLKIADVNLSHALVRLQEQSTASIAFSPSAISGAGKVSCDCATVTVREALERMLAGTSLRYVLLGEHIVIERKREITTAVRLASLDQSPADIVAWIDHATPPRRALAGAIIGRITDAQTRAPLPAVQVMVSGTDLGTQTDPDGRYRIDDVPAGTVTVVASRIGYTDESTAVTVTDGEAVTVNLQLRESALELEAIVVTGTPGEARLRSIGNVVGQIDADELATINATPRVQDLLGGAEPGVEVFFVGGGVNPGAQIRIRGASSISLRSDPLVFIDGVRANSGLASGPAAGFGNPSTRLADLNPEEIQSIEVVKGPAAATLYGTEASNGVINIITKRGSEGAPTFNVSVTQGIIQMPGGMENAYNPTYYRCQGFPGSGCTPGEIVEVNVLKEDRLRNGNVWFGTGHTQMYNASVSGGSNTVKYYFTGTHNRGTGISADDWKKQWNARANLDWTPSDKWGLQLGIGVVSSEGRTPSANQPITLGIFLACPAPGCEPGSGLGGALDGAFRGYFAYTPDGLINNVFGIQDVNRQQLSLTFTQRPFEWLSGRFVVGTDLTREASTLLRRPLPAGTVGHSVPQGGKSGTNTSQDIFTVDYSLTATTTPIEKLSLSTSAGLQYYAYTEHSFNASGSQFAAPTLETVNAGSVRSSSESYTENKTAGVFVQQSAAWNDRFYLTGALRFDDNSAFGRNFELVSYPKLSASFVASEGEHFDWLNQFRLRGAWGRAGQQPSTFAAVRTYNPVIGPGNTATLTRQNIGNPDLEPEIGDEWEVGFDATSFDERLSVQLTYYHQLRDNAIIAVPVKPSIGFGGTQFRNLGRIRNSGLELGVTGDVYRGERVGVNLGLSFWNNENEVESLGGLPPQPLDDNNAGTGWGRQRYAEGFPLGAIFLKRVVSADIVGEGEEARAVNVMCEGGSIIPGTDVLSRGGGAPVPCAEAPEIYMGTPVPSTTASGNMTLTLFDRLELYGQVDYQGGSTVIDGQIGLPHLFAHNSRAILERTDPILLGYESLGVDGMNQAGLIDASFARLRRVAATYHLPDHLSNRLGADRASITLAGRNLAWLWQAQTEVFGHRVVDHEQRKVHSGADTALQAFRQEGWPTMREWSLSVRVTF